MASKQADTRRINRFPGAQTILYSIVSLRRPTEAKRGDTLGAVNYTFYVGNSR